MTRQDYISGKVTHQEYYSAIAKDAGVSFWNAGHEFLRCVRAALDNGDENLNSIPLDVWDRYAVAARSSTARAFERHGDCWSLAGGVCLAKQAAREAAQR